MNELTIPESTRLIECEALIERGLKTFVDVGQALLEIRDSKLYRAEFGTFEEYCRERWDISRIHAFRMIEASNVSNNLLPIGNILPATESQARPLTSLEPEEQVTIWQQVVETAPEGKITAAHVQSVVDEVKGIKNPVLYSSNSDEWYTPKEIIKRVLWVLGEIDLDPCSNSKTEPYVPAKIYYTAEDDGLSKRWSGRVYMNPPYGREIADWITHFISEYERGEISEAIVLVPSRTDTAWFRKLRNFPRCFIWGRLSFSDNGAGAPFPSMAVYIGDNIDKFIGGFEDIGDVYKLI